MYRDKGGYNSRYKDHGDKYSHNHHYHSDKYRDQRNYYKSNHSSSSYSRDDDLSDDYRDNHSRYTKNYVHDRHSPYKSRYSSDSECDEEDDGKNIAEITGLDKYITEKDIENVIRQIAIKNGFSPPNSVSIFNSDEKSTYKFSINNNSKIDTNKAHVEFPSGIAVNRFIKSLKVPKIQINGNYYPVLKLDKIIVNNNHDIKIGQTSSKGSIEIINSMVKLFCDWNCPSCNYLNFSKRVVCLKCNTARPEEFQQQSLSLLTNISNLTNEYSSWIVIKDIPQNLTFLHFIQLFNDLLPDITGLDKIYYFSDINDSNMGFLFAIFISKDYFSSYFNMEGNNSTSQQLNGISIRLDWMLLKEQVVANDLINRIKFDVHKHQISNDNDKKYCKIYSTSISSLETLLNTPDISVRFSGYVSNWTGKSIWFADGTTDSDNWPIDKSTNYKFNKHLNLYYDPNSRYYMLSSGGYFVWDVNSSSLVRVEPTKSIINTNTSTELNKSDNDIPDSKKVIEEARKMAKASQSFKISVPNTVNNISIQFRDNNTNNTTPQSTITTSQNNTNSNKIKSIQIKTTFNNRNKPIKSEEISENLICFICLRYFDNIDQLSKHERLSDYHKIGAIGSN